MSSVVDTAQYNVTEILKKLKKHIKDAVIARQEVEDICHIYEADNKIPKEKIGEQVYTDCRNQDFNENEIDVIRKFVPDEFKDHKYDPKSMSNDSTLENLTSNRISNEQLDQLLKSTNDVIPFLCEKQLTLQQVQKLPKIEQKEYLKARNKIVSQDKAELSNIAEFCGIQTQEELEKESTILTPEELWGESLAWDYSNAISIMHKIFYSYWKDVADTLYKFKPTDDLDKEAIKVHLKNWLQHELYPMFKIQLAKMHEIKIIMQNFTDQKNAETAQVWMKIGKEKYQSYGNHGSGSVNSVLTGKHIMKLKYYNADDKDEDGNPKKGAKAHWAVLIIPVSRPYTREQTGDKAKFDVGQIIIKTCDKVHIGKDGKPFTCNNEIYVNNVPIEIKEDAIGDLCYQAEKVLLGNGLSNFIETVSDSVAYIDVQTPEQFFKREIKSKFNKTVTDEDIKLLEKIVLKPTKIKAEDIPKDSLKTMAYNPYYGRAGRRHEKAPDFSAKA